MDSSCRQDLSQFTHSAMEALRRAYEECPGGTTGSFIIIASNAIIRLEHELEKGLAGRPAAASGYGRDGYGAAA